VRTRASKGAPTKLTVRAYQVGFGDCFLLTWHYPRTVRHMLIDFGSNAQPKSARPNLLKAIAEDIKAECGDDGLAAVVLTHRHKDHIAGFSTTPKGNGPGDVIRSLHPEVVVQPWTEDPKAQPKATGPSRSSSDTSLQFVASLANMHDVSEGVASEARRQRLSDTSKWRAARLGALEFLGEEGIANESAVKNLQKMGNRHQYVYHGSPSGLERVLPGIKITVLGPPTIKQSKAVMNERSKDDAEFWMFQAGSGQLATSSAGSHLFPRAARLSANDPPPYARWIIPRLRSIRATGMLEIVRIMDDALNNTSVILLFEVGETALLFPGDAQIENWAYTLKDKALMKRLANVSLYKVGHHGSRNATPKSLWKAFRRRGPKGKRGRLKTIVSTMAGKYGKLAEGTEVPRKALVQALKAESDYVSTQQIKGKALKTVLEIDL
jgi:ribonuclease BN (tRNA processing enzyme)